MTAREAIESLLQGGDPPQGEYDGWRSVIDHLRRISDLGARKRLCHQLKRSNPALAVLMDAPNEDTQAHALDESETLCPPLPEDAQIDYRLGDNACPWLEEYITYSREKSAKAFDGYHRAVGLGILSIVAARRIDTGLGDGDYPMLYICLVGESGHAKTHTLKYGPKVLREAGLSYLLMPDDATPEAFLSIMAGDKVPANYWQLDLDSQEVIKRRVAFAGQRGWHFDEFGQKLDAMGRENGPMADFVSLLRRLYDGQETHSKATQVRGLEEITTPYLAMLCACTFKDMQRNLKHTQNLFYNGFFARFCFPVATTPPPRKYKRNWRREAQCVPSSIIQSLANWHKRLGIPEVDILEPEPEPKESTKKVQTPTPLRATVYRRPPIVCDNTAIREVFENYQDALESLLPDVPDMLHSNYQRLAITALHISALFASMECPETPKIEMRHWAYAQATTEQWRAGVHQLYEKLSQVEPSRAKQEEDRVLNILRRLDGATPADMSRTTRLATQECRTLLDGLVLSGLAVKADRPGHARCKEWYVAAPQEERAAG